MKANFTVTFEGFSEKQADRLEAMLRSAVEIMPEHLSMTSATVQRVEKAKKDAKSRR